MSPRTCNAIIVIVKIANVQTTATAVVFQKPAVLKIASARRGVSAEIIANATHLEDEKQVDKSQEHNNVE